MIKTNYEKTNKHSIMGLLIFCLAIFYCLTLIGIVPAIAATLEVGISGYTYKSIQSAIDATKNGDTVLVHDGTYVENINFNGKEITVRSENGTETTIIDGSNPVDLNYASVVIFASGETRNSIIDGFTLTKGSGTNTGSGFFYGGGVFCDNPSFLINNCKIIDNSAREGGGIFSLGSISITNCTISNNTATSYNGGGVNFFGGAPVISNCLITNNKAVGNGGGIACPNGSPRPVITGCNISKNTARNGGGIYFGYTYFSPVPITNCVIAKNTALDDGGGIYCSSSFSLTIKNCTINDNVSGLYGGGITGSGSSSVKIINSILWENAANFGNAIYLYFGASATAIHSDIEGGYFGTGNINADPLYLGIGTDNYYLQLNSPCIDTGISAEAPINDIYGNIRPYGSGYDMGAYEYIGAICPDGGNLCIDPSPDRGDSNDDDDDDGWRDKPYGCSISAKNNSLGWSGIVNLVIMLAPLGMVWINKR